jgi:hypothetical protein
MLRFILLLLFPVLAGAQTVGIHLVSAHQHGGMNNINPGIYARLDNGATAGFYRNSYSRWSVYAGYSMETPKWHGLSAALTVGAVSGYPAASVMALAVPSVAYTQGEYSARLAIVPKPPTHGTSASVHLMVERHF